MYQVCKLIDAHESLTKPTAQVVLAMSDQQLVTGLAIIISGYCRIQCGLSFYHWQLITSLVWFFSITHLATLMCLEQYFQQNRYIWYARAFMMTALALMLAVGMIPTGKHFKEFDDHSAIRQHGNGYVLLHNPSYLLTHAACSFDLVNFHLAFDGTILNMIISETLLLGGLVIRLVQMFSATREFSAPSAAQPRIYGGELWLGLARSTRNYTGGSRLFF